MDNTTQHSEDYIRSKVGNNSGFSVPTNYFDGIEESVLAHVSIEKVTKEPSFEVPTDYFSKLEDEIMSKVSSPAKETIVISLRERFLKFVPVAAAACVLLFVGLNYFNTNTSNLTIDDVSVAEIENWYDNDYGTTNNTELTMVLETSDFTDDDISSINIDEKQLEDYFNTTDNSSLLNEIE